MTTSPQSIQPSTPEMRRNMHLPPLPWSYETNAPADQHEGKGFVYLLDANGRKIGTVWGKPEEKLAIVQLIMDASDATIPAALEAKPAGEMGE